MVIEYIAVDEILHQLRGASYVAASRFYRCQISYIKAIRDPFRSYGSETMRGLDECLKAAEAYKCALRDLWAGLLNAAPFFGREEEMRKTMALPEIVFFELHAIQTLRFG